MKNTIKWLAIIALVVVIGFTMAACPTDGGGGDPNSTTYTGYDGEGKEYKLVISKATSNPGTTGGGDNSNRDSRIVNAANQAWVDSYPVGKRDGFIFKADGACQLITDYDYPKAVPGVWANYGAAGSWSTSGNSLTISFGRSSVTYSYTVTGTTLTLDGSEVYTKMTVTVSGRSIGSPAPAGNTGNKADSQIKRVAVSLSRATYAPQNEDKFILTIKNASGKTEGTSTGTVSNISGDTYTLDNGGKEFTAKIKGLAIEEISGPIPLDGGGELPGTGTLTPKKPSPSGGGEEKAGSDSNWKWTAVADSKLSVRNTTITYGGGKFVAVGDSGKIVYSADGASWTAVNSNSIYKLNGVAYGNGKFVAVGVSETIVHSSDGINWTQSTTDGVFNLNSKIEFSDITYGGGKFVVVGEFGSIAYSTNGTNWTAATTPFDRSTGYDIESIAYGGGKFVVGVSGSSRGIAYSDNGTSWTKVANHPFTTIACIAFGGNRFVACDDAGRAAYSADGDAWTRIDDFPIHADGITYGNGRFVAGGTSGGIVYSADGAAWTKVADSTFGTTSIFGIAYGNNRFVAVGQGGKMAYADW